jgi:septum formation protein
MIARTSDEENRVILASASPRRRQLMLEAGYRFEVHCPPIPEPSHLPNGLSPVKYAEALAYFKAASVADGYPHDWVLGADTVVAVAERILGKPADAADARRMLAELSSQRHVVITGLALVGPASRRLIASETTYVTMKPMTADEIENYIATGEWRGKAGAYAIQETADRYIRNLEGSWSNVVGLPMELLGQMLAKVSITARN